MKASTMGKAKQDDLNLGDIVESLAVGQSQIVDRPIATVSASVSYHKKHRKLKAEFACKAVKGKKNKTAIWRLS